MEPGKIFYFVLFILLVLLELIYWLTTISKQTVRVVQIIFMGAFTLIAIHLVEPKIVVAIGAWFTLKLLLSYLKLTQPFGYSLS